jgi:hypothetical protein
MSEERRKILGMLAEGKISVSEGEKLLDALAIPVEAPGQEGRTERTSRKLKYLRVQVEPTGSGDGKGERVNIRVPLQLLKAGVKLGSIMPKHVKDKVNDSLKERGVDFDLSSLDSEKLDELLEYLADLNVDVDSDAQKVRIFCE